MHNAPSVMYPVGRCAFQGQGLAVLAAIVAATLWGWRGAGADMRLWLAVSAGAMLWLVWAWRGWSRSPTGQLQWDAQAAGLRSTQPGAWFWLDSAGVAPQPVPGVDVALDLQQRVLLRLSSRSQAPRWIWVEAASDPARWLDLRRALMQAAG